MLHPTHPVLATVKPLQICRDAHLWILFKKSLKKQHWQHTMLTILSEHSDMHRPGVQGLLAHHHPSSCSLTQLG